MDCIENTVMAAPSERAPPEAQGALDARRPQFDGAGWVGSAEEKRGHDLESRRDSMRRQISPLPLHGGDTLKATLELSAQ